MAKKHGTTGHLPHEVLVGIIKLLGHCPSPHAINMLRAVATGADVELRAEAIRGLGRMRDVESLLLLIYTLRQDDAPRVRAVAAEALGMFKRKIVVDPLVGAFNDHHLMVRRTAARALARLGSLAQPCLQQAVKHNRWVLSLDCQRLVWEARRLLRRIEAKAERRPSSALDVTAGSAQSTPKTDPSKSAEP